MSLISKKEWHNKYNQVIVLSHNLAFLLELFDRKKIKTKKVLLIDGRFLPTLDGTFGQIIADLEKQTSCSFIDSNKQKVIEDLNALNDISWRAHHASVDELDEYDEVNVTKDELYRKYVPMTLSLLFGRL